MKKTLLAAALLAGFAGAASAQSSVTLYGVVDIGIQYQGISGPRGYSGSQFAMVSGHQSGSRWGLRGVEDLGGGLSANFVYEAGVSANTGADALGTGFGRQSTLGLVSKKWGSLDLGMRTAPSTAMFSGIDPFSAGYGQAALTSSFGANFVRYANMAMYTTPSFSGFTAAIGYSFDIRPKESSFIPRGNGTGVTPYPEQTFGSTNKPRALSLGVRYANGPILLAGTYDVVMAGVSTTGQRQPSTGIKNWALGGTYDFKVVKLHAAYGQTIDGLFNSGGTFGNEAFTGGDTNARGGMLFAPGTRSNQWMVGLSAPVGAATRVFANVQQQLPGGSFRNLPNEGNMTIASIGATYAFSKRTNAYASYSYMNNAGMVSGVQSNQLTVGLRHLF